MDSPETLDHKVNTAAEMAIIELGVLDERVLKEPGRSWIRYAFVRGAMWGSKQFAEAALLHLKEKPDAPKT
jgi:hypothetical protein